MEFYHWRIQSWEERNVQNCIDFRTFQGSFLVAVVCLFFVTDLWMSREKRCFRIWGVIVANFYQFLSSEVLLWDIFLTFLPGKPATAEWLFASPPPFCCKIYCYMPLPHRTAVSHLVCQWVCVCVCVCVCDMQHSNTLAVHTVVGFVYVWHVTQQCHTCVSLCASNM